MLKSIKQQIKNLKIQWGIVDMSTPEIFIEDEDYLDQIFGIEQESHTSVVCPDCGHSVSYFADLEFHNCFGEF